MSKLNSKRFVIRQSLIGKNQIIEVTFKNGKSVTYNHDKVYEVMKSKLPNLPTFQILFYEKVHCRTLLERLCLEHIR